MGLARRRRIGSGTVRRLPSGRWQARRVEADGTLRSIGTYRSKIDAQHHLVMAQADELRGERVVARTGGSVGEWAARWLAEGEHRWKASTLRSNRSSLRTHVLPAFGEMAIRELDREAIFGWLDGLRESGLAPRTVQLAAITLSGVCEAAVAAGAIAANPASKLRLTRTRQRDPRFLTVEQVEALAWEVEHPPRRPAGHGARSVAPVDYPVHGLLVRMAAYTGLRASEITGLRVGDVDLERQVIRVVQAAVDVGGVVVVGTTKSTRTEVGSRGRAVPLPGVLVDDLREHVERRREVDGDDGLVFVSSSGGVWRHNEFYRRHFRPAVGRAGLGEVVWHDLRHTYASLMIAEGVHPRALMELMGHSSVTVTLGTYGHLFPGLDQIGAAALSARIDAVRSGNGTGMARRSEGVGGRSTTYPLSWYFLERSSRLDVTRCSAA